MEYRDYAVIGYSFNKKKAYIAMANVDTGKIVLKKIGTVKDGMVEYDRYEGSLYYKLVMLLFKRECGAYINSEYFLNVTLRYYPKKDKWKYLKYNLFNLEFKVDKNEYSRLIDRTDVLEMSHLAVRKYVLL